MGLQAATRRSPRLEARRKAAQAAKTKTPWPSRNGSLLQSHSFGGTLSRNGRLGFPPVTARYKTGAARCALRRRDRGAFAANQRYARRRPLLFTETDDTHRRDVAVIGNGVRERFFAHGEPIGKTILVDGNSVEIIGTLIKSNRSEATTRTIKLSSFRIALSRRRTPRPRTTLSACWWSRARWIRRRTR